MLNLTLYSIPASIVLRLISCLILVVFLIPLQIKEATVQNGLRRLRLLLLAFGVVLLLANIFSLVFLFLAYSVPQKPLNALLQIINAVTFLVLSVLIRLVYKQQYTDESKDFHAQIHTIEEKEKVKKTNAKMTAEKLVTKAKIKADNLLIHPKH